MTPAEYTTHSDDQLLEAVDGMKLAGANVMVGRYEDDTLELNIYVEPAATPTGARWAFEDGTLPWELLNPSDQAAIKELAD
jgi:hypothetical protein